MFSFHIRCRVLRKILLLCMPPSPRRGIKSDQSLTSVYRFCRAPMTLVGRTLGKMRMGEFRAGFKRAHFVSSTASRCRDLLEPVLISPNTDRVLFSPSYLTSPLRQMRVLISRRSTVARRGELPVRLAITIFRACQFLFRTYRLISCSYLVFRGLSGCRI
jgi:hypothetical protein